MKFTTFVAAAVLVAALLAAAPAAAQDEDVYVRAPYHLIVSVSGGIGLPSQPAVFNDLWNATLPFQATVAYSVFPWLEVGGTFSYASWGLSENPAKSTIQWMGTEKVEGGGIRTMFYGAFVRVCVFPGSRLYPFLEGGIGRYSATADDVQILDANTDEVLLSQGMADAGGQSSFFGLGMTYVMNERWNAFTKVSWTVGLGGDFAPGNLVRRVGVTEDVPGENVQFLDVLVGVSLKL